MEACEPNQLFDGPVASENDAKKLPVAASGGSCPCCSKGYKNLPDSGDTNRDAGGIFNEDDP